MWIKRRGSARSVGARGQNDPQSGDKRNGDIVDKPKPPPRKLTRGIGILRTRGNRARGMGRGSASTGADGRPESGFSTVRAQVIPGLSTA